MAEPAIELKQITKRYTDRPVVTELDLTVHRGDVVMLIGPSGCGKTTTLKMINRLIEPTSGQVLINGEDVTRINPIELRRSIGYVIQQVGLFPHMQVAENVAALLRLLGWSKKKIANRVDELLDLVGLDSAVYRDRYPKELSGGQKQRVGVARALAADPPILLMDEPFGAVDPITRTRLQDELLRLQRDIRKTIVCVTHDVDEAVKLGDRIVVFGPGARVEQRGEPAEVISRPANQFVAEFIGGANGIRALSVLKISTDHLRPGRTHEVRVDGGLVEVGADVIALEAARPIGWIFGTRGERAVTAVPSLSLAAESTFAQALDIMLRSGAPAVALVDGAGLYAGCLELTEVHTALCHPAPAGDGG